MITVEKSVIDFQDYHVNGLFRLLMLLCFKRLYK